MSHRVAATSLEAAAARMGDVLRDIAEAYVLRTLLLRRSVRNAYASKHKTLFVCFDSNVPFFFFRRTGLELGRFPKIARVGDSKKAPASGSVYARAYENWRA